MQEFDVHEFVSSGEFEKRLSNADNVNTYLNSFNRFYGIEIFAKILAEVRVDLSSRQSIIAMDDDTAIIKYLPEKLKHQDIFCTVVQFDRFFTQGETYATMSSYKDKELILFLQEKDAGELVTDPLVCFDIDEDNNPSMELAFALNDEKEKYTLYTDTGFTPIIVVNRRNSRVESVGFIIDKDYIDEINRFLEGGK